LFTLALSAVLLRAVRPSVAIMLGVAATVAGVALLLARPG
jgi:drug/metabolite transporter (DMT)-like permease